jgi:hypothetical protein
VKKICTHVVDTVDPNCQWANVELGRKNLDDIFNKIPEDELLDRLGNDEYDDLKMMKETAESKWATPEEYAKTEAKLKVTLDHLKRLQSDEAYRVIFIIQKNVKHDPIFREFTYEVEGKPPYVVFVEHTGREDLAAQQEAEKIVQRDLDLLNTMYNEFFKRFGDSFGLEKLSANKRDDMKALKVFCFFSEEAFHKYQQMIGQPLPEGVRAYYQPATQWIILYEGRGFEAAAAKGDSSFNVNKVVHEGFHQLIHAATKAFIEKQRNEEVLWTDPATHSRLHWFQEGMAELIGSTKPKDGGGVEIMTLNKGRLMEWKQTRAAKLSEWTFEEMLGITTSVDMRQKAGRKALADAGRLASLFYAQAWTWCHFLYFHGDGKYRQKLIDYMKVELSGKSGPDEFKKSWPDMNVEELKKEWLAYVDQMMKSN